ncbi:MAG: response regulator [Bacilli bacterium]|nr:response regulator [Bacilli bacterium]
MKDKNLLIQNGVDLEKSLELFGDMEMYNESLGDFMSEIDNKLYKISHFKEMGDMHNYAILTHSLKTDAKYFGFVRLAELTYSHELQSKEKNIAFVNENYNNLIQEANRIKNLVKKYLISDTEEKSSINQTNNLCETVNSNIKSILVVDDSDIIKNFVKKIFVSDYHVLTANDGAEAINIIGQDSIYNIEAILLDLNMPNVDGFKVLDFMKEKDLFKRIPVSIITGNDNKEIDLNAFQYPIIDILKKPFGEEAVKNVVEKTINNQINF